MDYKVKSALTIGVLLSLMLVTAVFINNLEGSITGAVVEPACECAADAECDDGDSCTEDICLYKEDCLSAICVNNNIC
jgi:hypothetical protein